MPTTGELKRMAEHVQYEIDEFRKAVRSFEQLKRLAPERPPEWNPTLESILLHFRILRGFFFCENSQHRDDVLANQYVDRWSHTQKECRDETNVFGKTRVAIDKRLAHLTTERLELKNWSELDDMNSAIEELVGEFKKALSAERVNWFQRLEPPKDQVTVGTANNSTQSGPFPIAIGLLP